MHLNKFLTVTAVLASMFALGGCDKVATITGGPADGHDFEWYKAHHVEAKAEADYCIKKYNGPDATAESMAKIPNFCMFAFDADSHYKNGLGLWADYQNDCGNNNKKTTCEAAKTLAERYKIDVNSNDARDALAKEKNKLHFRG